MRRKQIGPELKLFELDTLRYITSDNVKDSIYYIGIYPERMSPADITFARKSGLIETSSNILRLSKIAIHYILGAISYREYAVLMLSKQWIKTTNVKNKPTVYNEPLLPFILEEIQIRGSVNKTTFTQEINQSLALKYFPATLSNADPMRYIHNLLIASELIVVEGNEYIINPLTTALVEDMVNNRGRIIPPTDETEYESYWNTLEHGIFDIINLENKNLYFALYPNLIK